MPATQNALAHSAASTHALPFGASFFTGGAPETVEQLTVRYRRWVAGPSNPGQTWVNLVVRERASRSAVGYVQATINLRSADIAWVIGTPWQRRGYATEASQAMVEHLARALHVHTLRALILPGHTASQVVASRLGLTCSSEVVDGEQGWVSSTSGQVREPDEAWRRRRDDQSVQ